MTITVRLTVAEWDALHLCARGELESLTQLDIDTGAFDDLYKAVDKLVAARKRQAVKTAAP